MNILEHDKPFDFQNPILHFNDFLLQFTINALNEPPENDVFFRLRQIQKGSETIENEIGQDVKFESISRHNSRNTKRKIISNASRNEFGERFANSQFLEQANGIKSSEPTHHFLSNVQANLANLKEKYRMEMEKIESGVGSTLIQESTLVRNLNASRPPSKIDAFHTSAHSLQANQFFTPDLNRGRKFLKHKMLKWFLDEKYVLNQRSNKLSGFPRKLRSNLKEHQFIHEFQDKMYALLSSDKLIQNKFDKKIHEIFDTRSNEDDLQSARKYKLPPLREEKEYSHSKNPSKDRASKLSMKCNQDLNVYVNNPSQRYSESGVCQWSRFYTLVKNLRNIWTQYLPHYRSEAIQHELVEEHFHAYNSRVSKKQFEINHLFYELSKQLNQHLSESIIRKRMKYPSQTFQHVLQKEMQARINKLLVVDEDKIIENAPSRNSLITPQKADCESYRSIISKSFGRVILHCEKKNLERKKNYQILYHTIVTHFQLLLEIFARRNRLTIVNLGDYRVMNQTTTEGILASLQEMSTYEASGFIVNMFDSIFSSNPSVNTTKNVVRSKNNVPSRSIHERRDRSDNFDLHLNIASNLERISKDNLPALHPRFIRFFRKYLKSLLKQKFPEGNSFSEKLSIHFPIMPTLETEVYQLVEDEARRIIFKKNEAIFRKKFLKEFAIIVPKDLSTQPPEDVLHFIQESGQVKYTNVTNDGTLMSSDILKELLTLASQRQALPLPSQTLNTFKRIQTEESNKKSITQHFEEKCNFQKEYKDLLEKLRQ